MSGVMVEMAREGQSLANQFWFVWLAVLKKKKKKDSGTACLCEQIIENKTKCYTKSFEVKLKLFKYMLLLIISHQCINGHWVINSDTISRDPRCLQLFLQYGAQSCT